MALGGILGQLPENELRVALPSIHRISDRPLKLSDAQKGRTQNRQHQFALRQVTQFDDAQQIKSEFNR
ncbi:MAG: hypothetical protein DVB32_09080 [Verrucomicrobia bacterium]|nr:MAG: hypothetical protein DVB32_09080 [Verrucomicrobiota bacterium]